MSPRPSGLTAISFNCDPQQADDIFLIKYDARATEFIAEAERFDFIEGLSTASVQT